MVQAEIRVYIGGTAAMLLQFETLGEAREYISRLWAKGIEAKLERVIEEA
mgnify:CR=1 FL=1